MFDFNLDMENVEEVSFKPLPPGIYQSQIEEASLEDTKDGTGKYIKVMFNVVSDSFNNRKFFEQFNIFNASEEATRIGRGQLKAMLNASGANIKIFNDPAQLMGLECMVKLKVVTDEYGDKNRVVSYDSVPEDLMPDQIPTGADGKPVF